MEYRDAKDKVRPYTKQDLAYDLRAWMHFALVPGSVDPVATHPAWIPPATHSEPAHPCRDQTRSESIAYPDSPTPRPEQSTNLEFDFPEDPIPSIRAAMGRSGIHPGDVPHLLINEVPSGVKLLMHMGHVPLEVPSRNRRKRHSKDRMNAHQQRCIPQSVTPVALRPDLLYYHHDHIPSMDTGR